MGTLGRKSMGTRVLLLPTNGAVRVGLVDVVAPGGERHGGDVPDPEALTLLPGSEFVYRFAQCMLLSRFPGARVVAAQAADVPTVASASIRRPARPSRRRRATGGATVRDVCGW